MSISVNMSNAIEMWPVERLVPYSRNARTHSAEQVSRIAASIVEFGFTNPLLVGEDGVIIAGHGRFAAACKLELTHVPVVVLDHLTPTQRKAYILADNRLALDAGWDQEMLALEMAELSDAGFDLELTGFSDDELDDMLRDVVDAGDEPQEQTEGAADQDGDEFIPEVSTVLITRPGDIWLMGEHRLVCGDSTDKSVMASLMDGERATLLFTSPPYANQRSYTTGGISDWDSLMQGVFGASMTVLDEAAQVLVNLGLVHREGSVIQYWNDWLSWMPAQGWRFFGWYIWDQMAPVPGDWAGRLGPRHEFIFHFNRKARKPNKTVPCKFAGKYQHLRGDGSGGDLRNPDGSIGEWCHAHKPTQEYRIPDSVIPVMRQRGAIGKDIDHPAVFPVALPEFAMQSYTDVGDIVLEPFSGSGTSIIAAEQAGRRMRAVELAPAYVDVAVKRWLLKFPHIMPTLKATGQTWTEVVHERGDGDDVQFVDALAGIKDEKRLGKRGTTANPWKR